jgi:hypothetical protein
MQVSEETARRIAAALERLLIAIESAPQLVHRELPSMIHGVQGSGGPTSFVDCLCAPNTLCIRCDCPRRRR